MEVRELKTKDLKILAGIIGKLKPESIKTLSGLSKEMSKIEAGLFIFKVVGADLADEIYEWLADIAGMTVQELDETDISTIKEIITQLTQQKSVKDFFGW